MCLILVVSLLLNLIVPFRAPSSKTQVELTVVSFLQFCIVFKILSDPPGPACSLPECCSRRALCYNNIHYPACQHLFWSFFEKNSNFFDFLCSHVVSGKRKGAGHMYRHPELSILWVNIWSDCSYSRYFDIRSCPERYFHRTKKAEKEGAKKIHTS